MTIPFLAIFIPLLAAYLFSSEWAGLDSRYPIGMALALLVVSAIEEAVGNGQVADALTQFVFFLLLGGVLLLFIDYLKKSRSPSGIPLRDDDLESRGASKR